MEKKIPIPLETKVEKQKSLTGFTLIEIIVATVLIALTLTGLANIFVAGRRYIVHSRSRMTGGELGKVFLDPLQMAVTMTERTPGAQNGWGQINNCLTNPPGGCPGAQTIDNILYTPNYTISEINMGLGAGAPNNLRRVELDITWNEPAP